MRPEDFRDTMLNRLGSFDDFCNHALLLIKEGEVARAQQQLEILHELIQLTKDNINQQL